MHGQEVYLPFSKKRTMSKVTLNLEFGLLRDANTSFKKMIVYFKNAKRVYEKCYDVHEKS